MHVPEYFWYSPFNPDDWAGFRLQGGAYQEILPDEQGRLVSQVLGLCLVRWQGFYKEVETTWLRWANLNGTVLPTAEEQERYYTEQERQRAEQERQRAEQERQRAEQERQRAEQAEARIQQIAQTLLQTGMPPEQVAQLTGLTIAQVEALRSSQKH